MYQNILVGVDGSENSIRALAEAIKIATCSQNCSVQLVTVVDFSKSKDEILHTHGKEELELVRKQKLIPAEKMLQEKNISYTIQELHGEAGPTIVKYANQNSFDLVVIGSRGLNVLQEMVLGSVSHKIAKRVKCPVLIVK